MYQYTSSGSEYWVLSVSITEQYFLSELMYYAGAIDLSQLTLDLTLRIAFRDASDVVIQTGPGQELTTAFTLVVTGESGETGCENAEAKFSTGTQDMTVSLDVAQTGEFKF
jgi:hypothetical protein